ncbi:MAG: SpoIIE family protein phosphatase, partial [Acidobacteriaceae bacterium]|nr:SpoIIE family protein phosphatase [Acidobacteriaceae bacterium]
GDRILRIEGRALMGDRDGREALLHRSPHELVALDVVRKGESAPITVRVPLGARLHKPLTIQDWTVTMLLALAMLFCTAVGVYAAAVRPYDARALFFFGLMLSCSQMVSSASTYEFPHDLWVFAFVYHILASLTWGIWIVLLALAFPERFGWDKRRPGLKYTFLVPLIAWTILLGASAVTSYWRYPKQTGFFNAPDVVVTLVFSACVSFFFAALGTKLGTVKSRDSKRRLRILYAGALLGLTPLGVFIFWQVIGKIDPFKQSETLVAIVAVAFCLFPATLSYAVVTERAMELRMVVRHSFRYALAQRGVRVVFGICSGLIIAGINVLVWGRRMSLPIKLAILISSITAVVLLMRQMRIRLLRAVDRKFFREAYHAETILEELSDTVRTIVDEEQMLETVARRISASLHVSKFAVLLNNDENFRPVYCIGFEDPPKVELAVQSQVVDVVKESKEPPQIYFDREDNWVHQTSESELLTLKSIHAQLLLPVGTKQQLLGILSLGPKLSEEPYTKSDVHLLRSVAIQTGLALENSRLTKTVASEIAEREKMSREMEIAREVQERLFPQRLPVIAGIDYYGACRPALGVGGDYYDFLPLANGDLGIAIGDVSGKGIAAALLMASLQASLRGQALVGQGDLARLMGNVNQLVYDATPPNRYATFFYGQYHRESRIFRYVNAGHNPPIVLRRTNDGKVHVIRLDTGGPVVGLFPHAPYQEGSLEMHAGDLFVGFTDGISEAMNTQEEEWGEERLIPAVAACSDQKAAEIIPTLMAEADRFASGAPQHDDMTLVVLKLAAAN